MKLSNFSELIYRFENQYNKEKKLKTKIREKYNIQENEPIQLLFINPKHNFAGPLFQNKFVYWISYKANMPNSISIKIEDLKNVSFITEYEKLNYEKYDIREKNFM
jgi:hypothetical protein